jgi:hypothetical protein
MNFLNSRLITGLPNSLAGVLVISTVAVWKTGTSYYNTIILHPELWCLFFSLIWLLYFIFIFPSIFFLNLNPRFHLVFLEKRWLSKSSRRKLDMLHHRKLWSHLTICFFLKIIFHKNNFKILNFSTIYVILFETTRTYGTLFCISVFVSTNTPA